MELIEIVEACVNDSLMVSGRVSDQDSKYEIPSSKYQTRFLENFPPIVSRYFYTIIILN